MTKNSLVDEDTHDIVFSFCLCCYIFNLYTVYCPVNVYYDAMYQYYAATTNESTLSTLLFCVCMCLCACEFVNDTQNTGHTQAQTKTTRQ